MSIGYDITIAILTKNSENTLKHCLESILLQKKGSIRTQLLVLDNGSIDSTVEILDNYGIIYTSLPDLNIPQLRNTAVKMAKSEIVGFIDSDCVIEENWINTALQIMKEPNISITGYKYSLPENCTWLQSNWYINNNKKRMYNQLIPAGNLVVKKSAFWSIGGFDEKLETGEDADLLERANEAGLIIVSDPNLVNYHLGFPGNFIEFYKKEKWYGKGVKLKNLLKGFDKPTIGAIIFFFGIFFAFISVLFLKTTIAIGFASVALFACVLSAVHRKYINYVGHGIVAMSFIYVIYFFARISAIISIVFRKIKKYYAINIIKGFKKST